MTTSSVGRAWSRCVAWWPLAGLRGPTRASKATDHVRCSSIGLLIVMLAALTGLNRAAMAQSTQMVFYTSVNGGPFTPGSQQVSAGSTVIVEARVTLAGATAVSFGGGNFQINVSNWTAADTAAPFTPQAGRSGVADGEFGRIAPYGAVSSSANPFYTGTAGPTLLINGSNSSRIALSNNPPALGGAVEGTSNLDAFRFGFTLSASDAGRTLVISGTNAQTARWFTALTGTTGTPFTTPFVFTGATIVVVPSGPPVITRQPTPIFTCQGSSVAFSVEAVPSPALLSYQWRKDGTPIAGATSATLTISPVEFSSEGSYDCVVTNSSGSVTSNSATLGINEFGPLVTQQPESRATCIGQSASFTVGVTGSPAAAYQWRRNGVLIPGANSPTFTISSTGPADVGSYDCIVSDSCGSVISGGALLSVRTGPVITLNPASRSVCVGQGVTFAIAANATPTPMYQWRRDRVDIPGATGPVFTIPAVAAADADSYDCVVMNTCGAAVSATAVLTVTAAPVITLQPVGTAICEGGGFTLTTAATGSPQPSFQWRRNGFSIPGANAPTYQVAAAGAGDSGLYDCIVSNGCTDLTTNPATIAITPLTTIVQGPAAVATCRNSPASFSIVLGGASPTSLQWRRGGVAIPGATAASYLIPSAGDLDAGSYDCVVTTACGVLTSSAATLTVQTPPSVTVQPADAVVCAGTGLNLAVAATGVPAPSYQWRRNGATIPGATQSSYLVASAGPAQIGTYDCVISNACGSVTSASANVTVSTGPSITLEPQAADLCSGAPLTLRVAATSPGTLTFQWRRNGGNLAGQTSDTLSIGAATATDTGLYDCVISDSCSSITSSGAIVSVSVSPVISVQPVSRVRCAGVPVTLSISATATPAPTFQWRRNGTAIGGATGNALTIAAPTAADAGTYDCVVSNSCGSVSSSSAVLTVNAAPSVTVQPLDAAACAGTSATFTVGVTGSGSLTYQWRFNGGAIAGATAATLVIPAVAAGNVGSYDCVITNSCGTATSAAAALSLQTAPAITVQPVGQTVCEGTPLTLSLAATGVPAPSYQWRRAGVAIPGANGATLVIASAALSDSASYDCVVSNACNSATSSSVGVTVNPRIAFTTQPTSQTACAGAAVVLTAAAVGPGGVSYQWQRNGVNIAGATSPQLAFNPVQVADGATYTCVASGTCGPTTSSAAVLTVGAAPVISAQPVQQIGPVGGSTSFSITASGLNVQYRWRRNGVALNNTSRVTGVLTPTLTINPVAATDDGIYDCLVTSTCGQITSTGAQFQSDGCPLAWSANIYPAARAGTIGHTAAYDSARGHTLVFGGGAAANSYQDLWAFDGTTWNLLSPSGPSPRPYATMVFDEQRDVAVLFGGFAFIPGGPVATDETWEWNGTSWLLRNPAVKPAARRLHTMAYDRVSGRSIVFGGVNASAQFLDDTWTWDGSSWARINVPGPTPRGLSCAAFDPDRGVMVLFGGRVSPTFGGIVVGDTWEFDGVVWTLRSLAGGPAPRSEATMVYDPYRRRIVMFGGRDGDAVYGDTWEWDGSNWLRRASGGPAARLGHAMAFDTARAVSVVVGGASLTDFFTDTWELGRDLVIRRGPEDQTVVAGREAVFGVTATASSGITYRWRRNAVNLQESPRVIGVATPTLRVRDTSEADAGMYSVVATSGGCALTSFGGRLTVRCPADFDDGSGTGVPDGGVGIEDLLYYLNIYDGGLAEADLDDGSSTGTQDGGVGIEDLLYFLQRYDGGC